MSILDKKTNRLYRLNTYRRIKNLTTNDGIGNFEIEVSSEAIEKLKKIKPIIFSVENDFGNENKEKMYWLRVNSEYPNKKTDFSYLVTGTILLGQHSDSDDWGITIEINHIDVSTKWGLLLAMTELIAVWIDKKYGKDYGFEKMYKNTVYNFENIRNKKTN